MKYQIIPSDRSPFHWTFKDIIFQQVKPFVKLANQFLTDSQKITKVECLHVRILKAVICGSTAYGLFPFPYSSPEKILYGTHHS